MANPTSTTVVTSLRLWMNGSYVADGSLRHASETSLGDCFTTCMVDTAPPEQEVASKAHAFIESQTQPNPVLCDISQPRCPSHASRVSYRHEMHAAPPVCSLFVSIDTRRYAFTLQSSVEQQIALRRSDGPRERHLGQQKDVVVVAAGRRRQHFQVPEHAERRRRALRTRRRRRWPEVDAGRLREHQDHRARCRHRRQQSRYEFFNRYFIEITDLRWWIRKYTAEKKPYIIKKKIYKNY